MRRYLFKYIWRYTCERLKLSRGVWTVVFRICLQTSCALSAAYMCCWTLKSPPAQAQGAQCHSVSSVWEPLEWNVKHSVGFQHLSMHSWILLACLDSCLFFLIISVLSLCKNNFLTEVLQRVLGLTFWAPGCRGSCSLKNPVPVWNACHAVQHSSDHVMSWGFYNLFIPFLFPAIFLAFEGLGHTLTILPCRNDVTKVSANGLN